MKKRIDRHSGILLPFQILLGLLLVTVEELSSRMDNYLYWHSWRWRRLHYRVYAKSERDAGRGAYLTKSEAEMRSYFGLEGKKL
jgi:hypothetical protein